MLEHYDQNGADFLLILREWLLESGEIMELLEGLLGILIVWLFRFPASGVFDCVWSRVNGRHVLIFRASKFIDNCLTM